MSKYDANERSLSDLLVWAEIPEKKVDAIVAEFNARDFVLCKRSEFPVADPIPSTQAK